MNSTGSRPSFLAYSPSAWKAREGRIVASNKINYGLRYTENREGYEAD